MTLTKFTNLVVGEVGTPVNSNIQSATSVLKLSFSSDGVSQLEFSVHDKGFKMVNANYFQTRRPVYYITPGNQVGSEYEIAAVEAQVDPDKGESVDVTCRTMSLQKIKRDKGAANFGAISPTSFAANIAAKFGLEFFGEPSPAKEAIIRTQNETTDESSWDVLRRLAGDLEFELFEADNILYFASQDFLLSQQPEVTLFWPPHQELGFPTYQLSIRASEDDPLGATLNAQIDRANGIKMRPGMKLIEVGIKPFEQNKFMITRVDWEEASPQPVKLTATSVGEPVL